MSSFIGYNNVVDSSSISIQSASPSADVAENTLFPISNIKQREPHKQFKPAVSTDTSVTLRLTLPASQSISHLFIGLHALNALTPDSVEVKTYSDAYITLQSTDTISSFNQSARLGYLELAAEVATQHIELTINRAAGDIALGNIFLGTSDISRGFPSGTSVRMIDSSRSQVGRYRNKFTDKISVKTKELRVSFNALIQSEKDAFEDMFDEVGVTENVYIMVDSSETNSERNAGVFTIRSIPQKTISSHRLYNLGSISFEEVI